MAILNKLFSSRKKNQRPHFLLFGKSDDDSWKPFDFEPKQIRVLLFRECDSRRRKILFDSFSVQKVALDAKTCSSAKKTCKFGNTQKPDTNKKTDYLEVTNGYGYKCSRPTEEINLLTISDMIFGTVPLVFQGTSMKIHSLKAPARLMCTKVFPSPSGGYGARISEHSLDDSVGSLGESLLCESGCSSVGEVGLGGFEKRASEEDSGFCGDLSVRSISLGSSNYWLPSDNSASFDSRGSSFSSVGSWLPNRSSGSMSSLQRRWWRHLSTSMEFCPSMCGTGASGGVKRSKLGLAIMLRLSEDSNIESAQQAFFFEHISVVENIMNRLRAMVERAYVRKETYWHLLKEGCDELQEAIVDLFSAPRLPNPVWLGLLSAPTPSSQSSLAHTFLNDLCQLLASLDTKSTNFFVSTLVTAVLTHHLGWVPTVLPGTSPPLQSCTESSPKQMMDSLAKSHPYNALWAQHGDLQGALGYPVRVSRTIVTGQKIELIDKLVRVLTYFVRCGAVTQIHEERLASDVEDRRLLKPFFPLFPYDHDYSSTTLEPSVSLTTLTSNNMESSTATIVPKSDDRSKLKFQRTESFLSQMNDQICESSPSLYPSLADACSDLDIISEKVSKLCRVPTEAIMYHLQNLTPKENLRKKINSERQMSSVAEPTTNISKTKTQTSDDVIFVLGDDEKLVGLKNSSKTVDGTLKDSIPILQEKSENTKDTGLYLKGYHSVRFHADHCDEGEDCCLVLGGPSENNTDKVSFEKVPSVPNFNLDFYEDEDEDHMKRPRLIEIMFPMSNMVRPASSENSFAASLLGCASDHYIADMVIQACTQEPSVWKHKLRRDLALTAHQPLFDREVAEAVCVIADTKNWEVQVVSSHTYVVDQPGNMGVRQGMSQLVANMLESVHHLWKLHTPPEHCLQHLESKLRGICLHSHALAQLLLATDCCEMEQLTSALNLEANDVPLLLAVASTHSPQVTQRYGLSFR